MTKSASPLMPSTHVRLYVAGDSPNSASAAQALREALGASPKLVQVDVIDVLQEPERALADGVLITPMLVRVSPKPERRILGDLSDRRLLVGVLFQEDTNVR